MRILIADDEPLARMRLKALIGEIGGHEVIAEAANGKEALELVKIHAPDVLMLDIGMPGVNGMEAAKALTLLPSSPAVIFTTAYEEYALEAFERQAVDYLLKPIRKQRLEQALIRAQALHRPPQTEPPAKRDSNNDDWDDDDNDAPVVHRKTARTHISVHVHNAIRLIPVEKIYFFRAEQKYVTLRWKEGEALMDEALKSLEPEFSGQFLRIHRNALVALVHIAGLEKNKEGQNFITFKEIPDKLEVSRRHLPNVKRILRDMRI